MTLGMGDEHPFLCDCVVCRIGVQLFLNAVMKPIDSLRYVSSIIESKDVMCFCNWPIID